MPAMHVDTTGDHKAVGFRMGAHRLPIIHTTDAWTIDVMEGGMESGATSLMVMIPVNVNGVDQLVLAETSVTCWMMASSAIAAKCQEEIEKPGWAVMSAAARAVLLPRYSEAIRRAIPNASHLEALDAAGMMLDSMGS